MNEEALKEAYVSHETKEDVVPYVSNEPQEIKDAAGSQGWTDFNKWVEDGKDAKEWRPASVFIERGELFKQHASLKKRSDELTSQLKVLGDHNKKMAKVEYDKAVRELKSEKLQALENQDHQRVMDIDEELLQVKEVVNDPINLEDITFDVWQADSAHDWYKDPVMRQQADAAGSTFRQDNPEALASEVYAYAEDYVKKQNPQQFKIKDVAYSKVGSSERTTGDAGDNKERLPSIKSMPFEFRKVAESFEQQGIMSVKDYMQQTADVAKSEGKTLDEYIRSLGL